MNKTRLWIVLAVLAATALACNALSGIGKMPTSTPVAGDDTDSEPQTEPTADNGSGDTDSPDSEFPLPDGVSNFLEVSGVTTFQTTLSLDDAMEFYLDELAAQGYTERELLTVSSGGTFSMVFDGHASGKSIVVQGVDLGGSTQVSISLQEIPK